jgi:biopolymer transport protein TolR
VISGRLTRKGARAIVIRPVSRLNNEINVTPLVDVVLVLLIIFMVVTPLLEKDIAVQVAASQQVEQALELPKDQIVVALDGQGALKVNAEDVNPAHYVQRLKELLAHKPSDQRVVFFSADDAAGYAKLVSALDGAKSAGATVLGLTPEARSNSAP